MKHIHKTGKVSVVQYASGAIEIERRAVLTPEEAAEMTAAINTAVFACLPSARPKASLCSDGEGD